MCEAQARVVGENVRAAPDSLRPPPLFRPPLFRWTPPDRRPPRPEEESPPRDGRPLLRRTCPFLGVLGAIVGATSHTPNSARRAQRWQ